MERRREFILLRGWGIALVVLGHCLDPFLAREVPAGLKSLIYTFHIPLFFSISGFFGRRLFLRDGEGIAGPLGRQAARLLVPYAAWSLLVAPVKLALNRFAWRPLEPGTLWSDVLFHPHDNPMIQLWFLYALFMVQCFFLCFNRLARPDYRKPATAAAVGAALALANLAADALPTGLAIRDVAQNAVYFLAGHLASLGYRRLQALGWRQLAPLLAALPAYLWLDALWRFQSAQLAFAFLGIALSWLLAKALAGTGRALPARFLETLGAYSLEIFLLHYLFLVALRILLVQVLGLASPFLVCVLFPATLLGSLACAKLLPLGGPRLLRVALGRVPDAGAAKAAIPSRG